MRNVLADSAAATVWLDHLTAIGEPDFPVALPENLPAALLELAVPHEDIDTVAALAPQVWAKPELRWLIRRGTHSIVRAIGEVDRPPDFPRPPADADPVSRYIFVFIFLTIVPHVKAFHQSKGISADLSRLTLADLGRTMAKERVRYGTGGLRSVDWLMSHFRGVLYQLGRLQFERVALGTRTGNAVTAAGHPYGPGSPSLSIHIPGFYGPLTTAACDRSLAQAASFFERHFPDQAYQIATCHSWLLDPQLADYLPGESNILRFQRRFQMAYEPEADDKTTLLFVFGRTDIRTEDLSRDTTLQRAVSDHLLAGGHWHGGAGWLLL